MTGTKQSPRRGGGMRGHWPAAGKLGWDQDSPNSGAGLIGVRCDAAAGNGGLCVALGVRGG